MLGPWYVGDTPTADLVVTVDRDGEAMPLAPFGSVGVTLVFPNRAPVPWSGATISGDTIVCPAGGAGAFTVAGRYSLFARLVGESDRAETFPIDDLIVYRVGQQWPPTLDFLKDEARIPLDKTDDDSELLTYLEAATSFVQRVRAGSFDFSDSGWTPTLPAPTPDLRLGTVRLAYRWHVRRRSPEMLASAGELGSARIPTIDPDIDRLLGIGRSMRMGFA